MTFASYRIMASLGEHIGHIVIVGAEEEVIWIHT